MDNVHRRGSHGRDVKPTLDDTAVAGDADAVIVLLILWGRRLSAPSTFVMGPLQPDRRAHTVQDLLTRRIRIRLFVGGGTMPCDARSGVSEGNEFALRQILAMQCRMSTRREAPLIRLIVVVVARQIAACVTIKGI
jgi:hypothetical protein